ncbi:hypothetical protein KSF_052000 [Reticulibacter mediterranei]|uniref:Uncharacterized protein n=1 Tax=Reticulibacter mediterranei TaxID=2778369 RepID=A0A8J3N273_9CHLR|nr:hypothetical protein KSF_052000 [Reticulibacter mediterranei]
MRVGQVAQLLRRREYQTSGSCCFVLVWAWEEVQRDGLLRLARLVLPLYFLEVAYF